MWHIWFLFGVLSTLKATQDPVFRSDTRLVQITAPLGRPPGIETMAELASETGGRAFHDSNNLTDAIRKAVDDAEVTYTLGFYPEPQSLDDKFHDLKVRVKHAGYEVRSPKGYFALKETPAPETQQQNALQNAILSPLESSAIRVQAKVERAEHALHINAAIDVRDLQPPESGDDPIDLYVIQQDATGRILEESTSRYNVRMTKEQYIASLKSGLVFDKSITPKDGVVTLRLLISETKQARVGSLLIPLAGVK